MYCYLIMHTVFDVEDARFYELKQGIWTLGVHKLKWKNFDAIKPLSSLYNKLLLFGTMTF